MKFKAVCIVPEYKNIGVSAIQFIASTKPCRNFIACTPLQSDLWPRSSKSLKNKMNVVKENNKKYKSSKWPYIKTCVSDPSNTPTVVVYAMKITTFLS